MNSLLPQWIIDISSISSIIGLIITIFLFFEARTIRRSFLRRARLPTITKELEKATSEISNRLKTWSTNERPALEMFAKVKALLENIKTKLPIEEQKKINEFLRKLQPRKYMVFKSSISEITEDKGWSLYTDLNTVVTSLQQLVKDSQWD
ncbi:hypothetical protein U737_05150 [Methylomonas sp. LW13]|uniref:hypothetical protein n=1 Tax=unclassified Methylomonas TaxID=2608980 RepID=UPI00051BBDC2|nr:hypothetical protein [Methylomonas sp. LW13]QBC26356.1 hypothetical protein U737_05150 [Methylomonas sp. LW13]